MSSTCNTPGSNRFRMLCLFFVFAIAFTVLVSSGHFGPYTQLISSGIAQSRFYSRQDSNRQNEPSKRVICMIMTRVSNWETRGKAVLNTWAQRCHKALFFYTKVGNCLSHSICKESSAIGLDVPDGRDHLTAKTFGALNYSYSKYATEADYFMKSDDDSYVIMENLQEILSKLASTPFLYLGRKIQNLLPKGYNSGGASYVLSKQAVELMLNNRTSFPADCPTDGAVEDYDIGRCLSKLGIYPQDDLDETGRLTFHSDNPLRVFQGDPLISGEYFINMSGTEFGNKQTVNSRGFMLSRRTTTMHYVTPPEMYMFEFLLYHLKRDRT